VAIVHNGIIENFQALRGELTELSYVFRTDTDTETVAILATHFLAQGLPPHEVVAKALPRLDGAFALAFLFAGEHDLLIGARRGSPLAIGYGDGEMFLGSDALALAPLTRRITYLEEGDWAVVTSRGRDLRRRQQPGRTADPRGRGLGCADRQRQLPPLHAEGDL
jgi:glucosamine--fructose-6-phosphate aminotransferase (isomerizing)